MKNSPSRFGPEPRLRATAAVAATVVVVAAMAGCGRCWCRLAQRGSSCFSTRALPSRCGRCLQNLESAMHIVQRLAMLAMVVAVACTLGLPQLLLFTTVVAVLVLLCLLGIISSHAPAQKARLIVAARKAQVSDDDDVARNVDLDNGHVDTQAARAKAATTGKHSPSLKQVHWSHICTGTALAAATSAPGLASTPGLGSLVRLSIARRLSRRCIVVDLRPRARRHGRTHTCVHTHMRAHAHEFVHINVQVEWPGDAQFSYEPPRVLAQSGNGFA